VLGGVYAGVVGHDLLVFFDQMVDGAAPAARPGAPPRPARPRGR
jgi:hypothetical protein